MSTQHTFSRRNENIFLIPLLSGAMKVSSARVSGIVVKLFVGQTRDMTMLSTSNK